MKHRILLKTCGITLLFQLLFVTSSFSQDVTVQGHVTNIFDKSVIGVSVKLQGTTIEVLTDSIGNYQITAPVKGKLVFARRGYETKKIAVKGKTKIDVSLALDLNGSNEPEVNTGFGSVKQSKTPQSSTSVDQKLIKQNTEVDIAQLLQSVAGVKVVYEGSEIKLIIRGMKSLNGDNYALIVLNGSAFNGSLNDLDRNSIESIEVLKDAASLTSYGSRGANGIVLISTKARK
jgi:TonB-dependent starch-binding outer membrane protein SusC